jgi:hypothetical protein
MNDSLVVYYVRTHAARARLAFGANVTTIKIVRGNT